MKNLENMTVVITGANGALGKAVTEKVFELDGTPVLLDLNFDGEHDRSAEQFSRYEVDLTDADATKAVFEQIGKIDSVLNIAGGFAMGPTTYETSDDEWALMFNLNVATLRSVLAASVPSLIENGKGSIVNVAASGAVSGIANMSAYCAAKSTVMRITESLSAEVKQHGVNVNAVLPAMFDTPRNRADMPNADFSTWTRPEELAEVICFLASPRASAVHGALIPVTGKR